MNESRKILLADDDLATRKLLQELLTSNGYTVELAENGQQALEKLEAGIYDHLITDLNMSEMDGLALLGHIQERGINLGITVISAHSEMDTVVKAIKLGADDFIAKPFQSVDEILITLNKVEERSRLARENLQLRKEVDDTYTYANIVAKSKKMSAIFDTIAKIADYKTTVLITGESGTGKELIAKAIHYNSCRRNKPLVSVNCGGIPDTLLESELFGHVKGAFTDAYRSKKGLFEEANRGTLFLDEMGELPLALQVKLLRVLQEEEVRPLGENRSIQVDVRIIAATARNLREDVTNNLFREDLFYRINVLTIEVPPLRERKEDIPLLIDHFIGKYNKRLGIKIEKVSPEFMQRVLEYAWPGNVRELENIVERGMALAEGVILEADNLPPELLSQAGQFTVENIGEGLSVKKNMKILEKHLINQALESTGGNKTKAAALLEISLPTLLYKMKEYGID